MDSQIIEDLQNHKIFLRKWVGNNCFINCYSIYRKHKTQKT